MKKLIMLFALVVAFSACDANLVLEKIGFKRNSTISNLISVELVEQQSDVNLLVEFTNNSKESISIFKPVIPGEFLGKDLFDIELDGDRLEYIGKLAVFKDYPDNWITFLPETTQSFSVDLSQGYDFPHAGYYDVTYNSYVSIKRETGEEELHYISSPTIVIDLIKPVIFRAGAEPPCNSSQNNKAKQAMQHGKGKTQNAINYLAKKGMDSYYVKWFGAKNNTRFNKIKTGYNKILSSINKGTEHLCATSCNGFAAYVYKGRPNVIHWCGNYISRAGTADAGETGVHEVSHWNVVMSTDDHVYGKTKAMNLAKNTPEKAIDNADNVCFYPYDIPNAPTGPVEPPIDPPVEPPTSDIKVSLYQHDNYKGYRIDLKNPRNYNINRLIKKGMKNDDISSIKVVSGYEAILYQDTNFKGTSKIIKGNVPSLRKLNFNDKLSSMKLKKSGTDPEPPVEPPSGQDVLLAGKFMKPGETLLSANGAYRFWFQNNGMLVIRSVHENGKVLWVGGSANAVRLYMQKDGNLVQRNANGSAIWNSDTAGKKATKLQMLSSGKLAIKNGNNIIWSKPGGIVDPPVGPTGEWTFVVAGDTRSNDSAHRSVLKAVKRHSSNYEIYLNSGDVVGDGTNSSHWRTFSKAISDILGSINNFPKYIACPGNHDKVGSSSGLYNWNRYLPAQAKHGNKGKYFFAKYKNALFIILDADGDRSAQVNFIRNTTKNNKATWIFASWHYPNDYSPWINALKDAKFDGVFHGHNHHYNRTEKGSYFKTIVGTGGAPLGGTNVIKEYGYLECKINGNQMRVKFIKASNGQVLDQKIYTANSK
jgi:peptidyl-Lys metalloendopeptidase